MAKPTCGSCFFWIEGRCSDGGRCFDLSGHRHAGQPRRQDGNPCEHYRARRSPPYFFIGGIHPADPQPGDDCASLQDLLELHPDASPGEYIDAEPFLLEQAREIRALLANAAYGTGASQDAIDEAFEHIREAADTARFWLRDHYRPGLTPRKFQLSTELARVGKRGYLSNSTDPLLISALLYGAQAAGALDIEIDDAIDDDPTAYPNKGLALLLSLAPDELRRAADAARDPAGMLYDKAGRHESTTVQNYIRAVVREYSNLSGRPGAPFSRDVYGNLFGPLVDLARACLAVVAPELKGEAIAKRLKATR